MYSVILFFFIPILLDEGRISFRSSQNSEDVIFVPQSGRKEKTMKEIFEQYGGVLITVVAVLAMIVVISFVIGTDQTSIVGKAFSDLMSTFVERAQGNIPTK